MEPAVILTAPGSLAEALVLPAVILMSPAAVAEDPGCVVRLMLPVRVVESPWSPKISLTYTPDCCVVR